MVLTALGRDQMDVADTRSVDDAIARARPDVIINASAYTAVDRAETEEDAAFALNADGPANLAAAAAAHGARLVHVSTDFVFDGRASSPYPVDAPLAPLGVYGRSKAQGEARVHAELPDAIIVRTAWLYDAEGSNFVTTMLRLMAERPALRVVSDQVGTPTNTSTLAAAIWDLLAVDARGIHHITDAGVASWYDFAVAIQDIGVETGRLTQAIPIEPIATVDYPTPARRPAYSVLDKSRTWPLLSHPPRHWRSALYDTLKTETLS